MHAFPENDIDYFKPGLLSISGLHRNLGKLISGISRQSTEMGFGGEGVEEGVM